MVTRRQVLFVSVLIGLMILNTCQGMEPIKNKKKGIGGDLQNRAVAIKGKNFQWNYCAVPYLMGRQFNSKFKATFEKAKKMFFALTGIIFVKKGTFDCDYVKLTDDKKLGCSSNIGKIGGEQIMNLYRDKYVKVKASSLSNNNYKKVSKKKTELYGTPYDFTSIMHYFFDGKMTPRRSAPKETGHVKTLSKYDKIAVEKRYGCIKNGKIVKKKRVIKKVKCKAPK